MTQMYRFALSTCSILFLVFNVQLLAGEQEFTGKVYAPKTDMHDKEVKITVELPDGWRYTEHNGQQYLIGGKDVYGSITIGYHPLSVFNLSSQFGTPNPPTTEVNGETVMHRNGAFGRKLSPGWILRASLDAYPAFKGKDMTSYETAFIKIIATAKVKLPESK